MAEELLRLIGVDAKVVDIHPGCDVSIADTDADVNVCAEIVERSWQRAIATVGLAILKQTILLSVY